KRQRGPPAATRIPGSAGRASTRPGIANQARARPSPDARKTRPGKSSQPGRNTTPRSHRAMFINKLLIRCPSVPRHPPPEHRKALASQGQRTAAAKAGTFATAGYWCTSGRLCRELSPQGKQCQEGNTHEKQVAENLLDFDG